MSQLQRSKAASHRMPLMRVLQRPQDYQRRLIRALLCTVTKYVGEYNDNNR